MQETRFDPWVRTIPWSRTWKPTPVFLPGKFHRQRRLVDYSPWGHKESDTEKLKWTELTLVLRLASMSFDHMGYSLPGSSVHGIFQARILEWVSISFSRRSSQPRDRTLVSYIASGFFTNRATREASRPHLCDISGPWASVWTWTLCLTEFKKCWKLPFSSAQLPE